MAAQDMPDTRAWASEAVNGGAGVELEVRETTWDVGVLTEATALLVSKVRGATVWLTSAQPPGAGAGLRTACESLAKTGDMVITEIPGSGVVRGAGVDEEDAWECIT